MPVSSYPTEKTKFQPAETDGPQLVFPPNRIRQRNQYMQSIPMTLEECLGSPEAVQKMKELWDATKASGECVDDENHIEHGDE